MNNLNDLKEQLQEDIIAYFSAVLIVHTANVDEVCQIIVDRVTELQDNQEEK